MGCARHPDRDAGDLRHCAVDCGRHDRYGHDAAHRDAAEGGGRCRGGAAMTFDIGMPLIPEAALFGLMVLVLLIGLLRPRAPFPHRDTEPDALTGHATVFGWVTFVGLLATLGLTFVAREGAT